MKQPLERSALLVAHWRKNVNTFVSRTSFFALVLTALMACSQAPDAETAAISGVVKKSPALMSREPSPSGSLGRLFGRIWRISSAAYGPASGAIYIFLPNGTLLETSCVETYRIASWTIDKKEPQALRVVEDQRPAFTAIVRETSDNTLQLQQTLLLGNKEKRELTLTAVDQEFVCPDLKK